MPIFKSPRAVLTTGAVVTSFLLGAGMPAHAQLDILLTNDDGFGEPGIEVLKTQLRAAGHRVSVGAPDGNASTSATSLDLTRPFWQVDCPEVDECRVRSVCVEGITPPAGCKSLEYLGPATPTASIASTIAALGKEPADFDLIISGINDGTNLGPQLQFSGTVGAAIAAISKKFADTPAIAVSMVSDPINATVEEVANFIVSLVAHLEDSPRYLRDGKLLPDGVGLNVNYPDLAREDVVRVTLTVQGRLDRDITSGERFVTRAVPFPPLGSHDVFIPEETIISSNDTEVPQADTTAFYNGHISITPIAADYTAGWRAFTELRSRLRRLRW